MRIVLTKGKLKPTGFILACLIMLTIGYSLVAQNNPPQATTGTPPANAAAPATTATQSPQVTDDQSVETNPPITDEDIIRANYGMMRSGEVAQFELLNDFENCEDWRALSTSPLGETRVRKVEGKPDNEAYDNETKMLEAYQENMSRRRMEIAQQFSRNNEQPQQPPANAPATPAAQPAAPAANNQAAAADQTQTGAPQSDQIQSNYVLGVKTHFHDRGFDRVEVFPPNEYVIRGRAKEIRVWALGRKFRHTLFVKLRDYRGKIHKLEMGSLDYFGWQRMKVTIPGWLPQSSRYALLDKNLHFVSFYVVSDPFESPGTFYFYMDNFTIVTDSAENQYDGSQILDTW